MKRYFCKGKKGFCENVYNCAGCEFADLSGTLDGYVVDSALTVLFGADYDLDRLREAVEKQEEYEQFMGRWKQVAEIAGAVKKVGAERAAELVEADRDGWCGVPPVKLHQRIYRVFDGKILEETVCKAIWEPFTPIPRWKVWVMGSGLPYYWNDCIGKTLFLTREAAEDALKGERGAAEI